TNAPENYLAIVEMAGSGDQPHTHTDRQASTQVGHFWWRRAHALGLPFVKRCPLCHHHRHLVSPQTHQTGPLSQDTPRAELCFFFIFGSTSHLCLPFDRNCANWVIWFGWWPSPRRDSSRRFSSS